MRTTSTRTTLGRAETPGGCPGRPAWMSANMAASCSARRFADAGSSTGVTSVPGTRPASTLRRGGQVQLRAPVDGQLPVPGGAPAHPAVAVEVGPRGTSERPVTLSGLNQAGGVVAGALPPLHGMAGKIVTDVTPGQ